ASITMAVEGTRWAISPAALTPPPGRSTSSRQRRGVVATQPSIACSAVRAVPQTVKPCIASVTAEVVLKIMSASATNTVASERSTMAAPGTGLLTKHVLRLGMDRTVGEAWREEGDMTPPAAGTLKYRMRARQGAAAAALVGGAGTVVAAVAGRGRLAYRNVALGAAVDTALA